MTQATAFLKVAGTHRLGALFGVALACGLRLGEATGLRWEDVDLDERESCGSVSNCRKWASGSCCSSSRRRRAVARSRCREPCLEWLKTHRTRQLADRLKAGAVWVDTGWCSRLIRAAREGAQGRRRAASAERAPRLARLAAAAGLPRVRFHDLRHSAASLLIAAGVELVEV